MGLNHLNIKLFKVQQVSGINIETDTKLCLVFSKLSLYNLHQQKKDQIKC